MKVVSRNLFSILIRSKEPLYSQIIYCEGVKDNVQVEVAFQHNDGYNEVVDSFVNNIKTPEGGTHLTGFRNSLTKTFNDYARKNKILKDSDQGLSGDDIREVVLQQSYLLRLKIRSLKDRLSRSLVIQLQGEQLTV